MTKLDEMWAALAAYQPQADAKGHGESWAHMCSEKTIDAANAAAADAYAAWAAYAAADAAAGAAAYAAANAAAYAAAADDADYASDAAANAEKYAQLAIDRINKARGNV